MKVILGWPRPQPANQQSSPICLLANLWSAFPFQRFRPTTGRVEELIAERKSDHAIVIVTLNPQQADHCSDYIACIWRGELIEFGATKQSSVTTMLSMTNFAPLCGKMMTYMMEDPRTISIALDYLFIAKVLERIGDHAMKIAEFIIYIVKGTRDVPHIEPSSFQSTQQTLRFLARDAQSPSAALVYCLGVTEPSREPSCFDSMQTFGQRMQLVLPEERPGVFVKRNAVHEVQDCGIVKRLVFKDGLSLDVRYAGPCSDLNGE